MENYKEQYILHCADLHNGFSKTDVEKHNDAMKQLSKLFYKVKNEADRSFLLELMQHNNVRIRMTAASHCLALNEYVKEAKKVLKAISKNEKDSLLSFEAKSTLKVCKENGGLKF